MTHLLTEPRQRPARLLAAALATLLLLLTGACGSSGTSRKPADVQDKVRVSGDFGQKPTITIATPLKVPATKSWTLVKGTGDPVAPQSTAILNLTMADARTGKTLISTTDQGQRPLDADLTQALFPSLVKAVTGATAGSRVVVASTAKDSYGTKGNAQLGLKAGDPVVLVADVLSSDPTSVLKGPDGKPVRPPTSAPRLLAKGGTPTGFDVSGLKKPKKVETYVLRKGTGRALDGPKRVAANYLGVVWGAKRPFDSSYSKEPAKYSVGTGGVVPCWDQGLAGVKAGARVVLVCPPSAAYGKQSQPDIPANSTLVFVIDVLGVG